ncbi:elongation factor P [Micavibrio aeruginosavorus]|uniref:elongation factor P n=1 Tax=Micavibrio aeruginosavorus TaxID=349221 RepID=UPI003F4AE8E0
MKIAQELRSGNVVTMEGNLMLVTKAEFSKSGRNASVMKLKMKNLITGNTTEGVYRADDKFENVVLDHKEVKYSYNDGDNYVFMDAEYNQYEITPDYMEDALKYLEDEMPCEIVMYDGRALSIEIPTKVVREVTYTEPAARGDTSGKVMKLAKLATGHEISVPAFIEIGEKIEIDTRTDEYVSRAK